ncbi:hypothetical protein J7L49_01680 [Candidatus Bathyarchaeota archaeon]|nr:hypothetical protein [Candidatus Bathyarchaeota archaeon]
MSKIKKIIESRKLKEEKRYREEKKEFEMAMGKPFITIKIELPEGFEDQRAHFLNLENDKTFLEEVEDLVKKRLTYEKHGVKPP